MHGIGINTQLDRLVYHLISHKKRIFVIHHLPPCLQFVMWSDSQRRTVLSVRRTFVTWSDSQRRTVLSICSSSRGPTPSAGRSSLRLQNFRHMVRLPAQDGPLCLQFVMWSDSQRRTVLSVCSSSCGPTPSAGRSSPFAVRHVV